MCCWGLIARQDIPHPGAKASPFGAVWKAALFKISRQMQITHSADTMEQTYMCHCNFCFHFLILPPETSRGTRESFVICKAKTTEQLWEKFLVEAALWPKFCTECRSLQTFGNYLSSEVPAVLSRLCEGIWSRSERRPGHSSFNTNWGKTRQAARLLVFPLKKVG